MRFVARRSGERYPIHVARPRRPDYSQVARVRARPLVASVYRLKSARLDSRPPRRVALVENLRGEKIRENGTEPKTVPIRRERRVVRSSHGFRGVELGEGRGGEVVEG